MIFNLIIDLILGELLPWFIEGLPTLPSIPQAVENVTVQLIEFITIGVSVASMILSPALLTAIILVISTSTFFLYGWETFMFIIRKLPFVNIS